MQSGDLGCALRTQSGHHQSGPAPQVGALHPLAVEGAACYHSGAAPHPDIRPHTPKFLHMAVAAFKHIFYK